MNKKLLILVTALLLPLASIAQDEGPVTKTLVWPDGTRYVGGVVDGKRSGKGTIFWQDGTRFVGQFENDMRNGPGTMILPDGTVYTGFFRNDELIDTEATIAASNEPPPEIADVAEDIADMPMEADSLAAAPVDTYEPEPEPAPVVEEEPDPYTYAAADVDVDEEDDYSSDSYSDDSYSDDSYSNNSYDTDTADSYDDAGDTLTDDQYAYVEEDDYDVADPYDSDVTAITDSVKDELTESIDLWAAAWSDKNVVQYLDNYSDDFAVPGNQSRRTWEALRRTRLSRPRYINLDVAYQRFEFVETNVVDVFFRQTYRSNTYSDLTDKVLRMRKEGTDWKILIERSR